jgi:GntR family transcriptional repressor for pyruvate dehydrogenase complex
MVNIGGTMQEGVPNPRRPLAIARITVPKPHVVLADRLRDSILKGEIPEGESLPSERDLVEQTGLTRGAVREALRTLSVEGLVHTKQGRFGGNIVTLPGHDSLKAAVSRFVHGRRIPLRSLQETRDVLEPFLARLAAERRTESQMEELRHAHVELVAAANNFGAFALANVRWHNAVAQASGNELLSSLLLSISHGVQVATMAEEYDTAETRHQVISIHGRINAAIEARDGELAERAMRQHMAATHARPLAISSIDIPLTKAKPASSSTAARKQPRKANS